MQSANSVKFFCQSINQNVDLYSASSQRCLLRVCTPKKPWLKARFKTLSTNVAVLQFRRKVVPHRWCRWVQAALTETNCAWTWDDHVTVICRSYCYTFYGFQSGRSFYKFNCRLSIRRCHWVLTLNNASYYQVTDWQANGLVVHLPMHHLNSHIR